MPTYEYICDKCGSEKEDIHSMKVDPIINCVKCDTKMRKIISGGMGFILKGNGWTGKNIKEKDYRLRKKREIGEKMANTHDIPQILPNYKGEICSNWDEAKKIAKNDGVNTLKYERQVDNLKKEEFRVKEKVNKLKTRTE